MADVRIASLADHPECIPDIARWLFEQWGADRPGASIARAEVKLRSRLNHGKIPLALVAFSGNRAIGTASIVVRDVELRPELSPWLASVYVVPEHRERGVGTALIAAAAEAGAAARADQLYLYTTLEEFYARRGWLVFERVWFRGEHVALMKRSLNPGQ